MATASPNASSAPARQPGGAPVPRAAGALNITVLNGNLSFVPGTLMLGHLRALQFTGTEKVVNRLIGGAMKTALDAGLYPDAPGSHQIFANNQADPSNPWRAPQPASVVVVGLGEEGQLTERHITFSVRQAVIAWAQRVAESTAPAGQAGSRLALSATLMGSGGAGISASTSARAIAQGVREANEQLALTGAAAWPLVSHLCLVELYLERASEAWQGLQVLRAAAPEHFEIERQVVSGVGPLRRQIDSGYRGTDYDFIAATAPQGDVISFRLDTKRARTEITAQSTQGNLLRALVQQASTDSSHNPDLGRTLFQLLVPPELEPFLAGTSRMLLELDRTTAAIPWELLDAPAAGQRGAAAEPWAIRTKLLRKLQQEHYRQRVQDAQGDDAVLVVGEPLVDPAQYEALPGARHEAQAVRQALLAKGGLDAQRVVALIENNDASSVINALLARRYRIVHVAGHGVPLQRDALGALVHRGGVVLSEGAFLGVQEIKAMRTVPELVFINCCHLAAIETDADSSSEGGPIAATRMTAKPGFDRAEFAMSVAEALIAIGVRCVIAAGWAVEDEPAEVFAQTFYAEILNRSPFTEAVAAARRAAWKLAPDSNTWAAYQAYGDPDWVFRKGPNDTASVEHSVEDEYQSLSSPLGLTLALEELAVRARWMHGDPQTLQSKVRHLEQRFAPLWGRMGAVAEALGLAYAESGEFDAAIRWYREAVVASDSSASMKAHEQWGNLMVRRAARVAKTAQAGSASWAQAKDDITEALRSLQALAALQPTAERHSLCASAWKRLAMLQRAASLATEEAASWHLARQACAEAQACAKASGGNPFYPLINRLWLDWMLGHEQDTWPGLPPEDMRTAQSWLASRAQTEPDFWCLVGLIEFDLLQTLSKRQLAPRQAALSADFAKLYNRVSAPLAWASVADQASMSLGAYSASATPVEAQAAASLLAQLQGYAASVA